MNPVEGDSTAVVPFGLASFGGPETSVCKIHGYASDGTTRLGCESGTNDEHDGTSASVDGEAG